MRSCVANERTPVRAGSNVGTGTDHTLFAKVSGTVKFQKRGPEQRMYVHVVPQAEAAKTA